MILAAAYKMPGRTLSFLPPSARPGRRGGPGLSLRRWLLIGLACSALQACSPLPLAPADTPAAPSFSGRLALKVAATGDHPRQSLAAQFELQGNEERGRLRLLSPLGMVLADASWTAESVSLRTADGQRDFGSLAELSQVALGESLPLGALLYWLAGQPWPGALALANDGGFSQLGWQVDLTGLDSAGLFAARRDGTPAIELQARLELAPRPAEPEPLGQ